MDPDFLHAINGDWDALLGAMRASRSLVHRADASGMSVLHWVCLHQDVPTDVVVKVVFANPHAARLRNDAGHLPLDLALQAECSERVLEILRAARNSDDEGDVDRRDDEPAADDEDDFGRSYFHDVNSSGTNGGYQQQQQQQLAHNHHDSYQPRQQPRQQQPQYHQQQQLQYQQQQQQPQYQHQHANGYAYQSPHHQQQHGSNYYDEPQHQHQQHQQHQQMVMYGGRRDNNSYRSYPEDDEDDRYSAHLPHGHGANGGGGGGARGRGMSAPKYADAQSVYSGYSHQAGSELDERQRGRSHSSSAGYNPLQFTEQRLQQREHDLISYATEDPHSDHLFEPSSAADATTGVLRPPVLDEWSKDGGKATKAPRVQSSFPPRWKQSRHCHVCMTLFTFTKRRHHCRNCGESVCGGHSTNRVALPKFGLLDPQRLCDKCFLMGHFLVPSQLPPGSGSFGIESIGSVPSNHHTDSSQTHFQGRPAPHSRQPQVAAYGGR